MYLQFSQVLHVIVISKSRNCSILLLFLSGIEGFPSSLFTFTNCGNCRGLKCLPNLNVFHVFFPFVSCFLCNFMTFEGDILEKFYIRLRLKQS